MIHGKSSSDGCLIHHMEMNPDRFKSRCGGRDHGCVHVLLCVHAYVGVHENRQRSTLGIFLSTLYITSWDRFCFLFRFFVLYHLGLIDRAVSFRDLPAPPSTGGIICHCIGILCGCQQSELMLTLTIGSLLLWKAPWPWQIF